VQWEITKAKRWFYQEKVQDLKKAIPPAKWYQQIRVMTNMNKTESSITPPPGIGPSDSKSVASSINEHFAAVANDLPPLPPDTRTRDPNINNFLVQPSEVYKKLKQIKSGKAGGPDGIPAKIIHEFSYELSFPLADILNQSYREGTVPPQWRKAVVVPIPKSKPATWDKLRPISLTDHFAKVAESFMNEWLMNDIESHIDSNQYGNRKKNSTTHYQIKLMDTEHKQTDKTRLQQHSGSYRFKQSLRPHRSQCLDPQTCQYGR
jgi:hypothetical protein